MQLTLRALIAGVGGVLVNPCVDPAAQIRGVTWDSREVREGNLFVCLPGERVDGHDFIVPAATAGARCILVMREPTKKEIAVASEWSCALVQVADTALALRDLAATWRDMLSATVIGITGSVGKTTTKDFLAAICSTVFKTVATQGNRNNELGVPATVLSADEDTQALIVEMGMRGAGQIADLASYVKPQIGIITNVGVAHLELLGTRENIALAKGEMCEALPSDGVAVLPGDDPFTPFILEHRTPVEGVQVLTFGRGEDCDIRAVDVCLGDNGAASFNLVFPDKAVHPVTLKIPGESSCDDALAAAAAGYAAGVPIDRIVEGLLLARSSSMRFETMHAACGALLINDAYNANPDSMRSALTTFSSMKVSGRKIAVLGDMGELGEDEERFHREVGIFAARSGLESLLCVGELAKFIAAAAIDGGLDEANVKTFAGVADTLEYLNTTLEPHDTVLFKASRSMGLERIVKGLL